MGRFAFQWSEVDGLNVTRQPRRSVSSSGPVRIRLCRSYLNGLRLAISIATGLKVRLVSHKVI